MELDIRGYSEFITEGRQPKVLPTTSPLAEMTANSNRIRRWPATDRLPHSAERCMQEDDT